MIQVSDTIHMVSSSARVASVKVSLASGQGTIKNAEFHKN